MQSVVKAQVPTIVRLDTTTLKPGQHAAITVHGALLKNAQRLWTPFAEFRPVAGHDVNSEQVVNVEADVTADVVPGIYPARIVTAQSCSSAAFVVVDDLTAHTVLDGSESPSTAPTLTLPCCVASQVNPAKSRLFQVALAAGQTVSLDLLARRLNSALDPVLKVTGPAGNEVAWCDNTPGTDGDSQLLLKAAEAGNYLIELHDVRYGGGATHFFHLRIGDFSLVAAPSPRLAAADSTVSLLNSEGQPLGEISGSSLKGTTGTMVAGAWRAAEGKPATMVTLLKTHGQAQVESEPNDDREHAVPVTPGVHILAGRLQRAGDVDWYRIHAEAAGPLCLTANTRSVGSPADVVLQLWNAEGGRIVEADDNGSLDAQLISTLPAAGDYFLSVSDLAGKGGSEWTYDLEIEHGAGRIELTAPADLLNVPRGGAASLVLTVKRINLDAPVLVNLSGLPASLKSDPIWLSGKQTTAALTLTSTDAKPDATDDDSGPIEVTAMVPDQPAVAAAALRLAARASKFAEPYRSPQVRADFFAAVAPAVQYTLAIESTQFSVAPGTSVTIPVKAVRQTDWTFPVELALAVPADQLPPGITITGASMAATDAVITVAAAADAAVGKFTLFAQGTSKKDDKTIVIQPLPSITVTVAPAAAAEAAK